MPYHDIIVESSAGICTVTFNRPKALNALNAALIKEFSQALDMLAQDPETRVLILTGSGEKAFVSGADINELAQLSPLQARNFSWAGHTALMKMQKLAIPVIAAVNGYALGGGSEIALACDFIYASEKARFGLPEITLGLIPGFGGTQRLPRLIGQNFAKELIFTGRIITAEEARQLGFVNRVCAPESLMKEVLETAGAIAAKGRVSVKTAKQAINRGMDVDLASGCEAEADGFALCMASADAKEGTKAFLEKRKAQFTGSLNE